MLVNEHTFVELSDALRILRKPLPWPLMKESFIIKKLLHSDVYSTVAAKAFIQLNHTIDR